jgi:hypothetical protein
MDAQLSTRVVKLAEAQHGVVTHAQLVALGMGRSAVKSRVRRGAL